MNFAEQYLKTVIEVFRSQKRLAEKAMAQLNHEELKLTIDPEANSVELIVKHLAGNMRSRWRDFLTSDGEKPDRNRDTEFEGGYDSYEAMMASWEEGWQILFGAIGPLTEADLAKPVYIRGEAHSVIEAIERQISHYGYHVGQIVFLAKHLKSKDWQSLSIPRGGSSAYNQSVKEGDERYEKGRLKDQK